MNSNNFFDSYKQESSERIIPVIFVIDTSGSMSKERLDNVKRGILEFLKQLTEKNKSISSDLIFKIAILSFSSETIWHTDGLVMPEQVDLDSIKTGSTTNLGCALDELNKNFSREMLFTGRHGYCTPFVCFVVDGMPTDDYKAALDRIRSNKWFKKSKRLAFGIGQDIEKNILYELTENIEAAIEIESENLFPYAFIGAMSIFTNSITVSASCINGNSRSNFEGSCPPPCQNVGWNSFDSDKFGATTALETNIHSSNTFDSDSVATSAIAPAVSLSQAKPTDGKETFEKRRRLADALRKNESVTVNSKNNVINPPIQANIPMPPSIQVPNGKLAGGFFKCCFECGKQVPNTYAFCPHCGTRLEAVTSKEIAVDQIEFSAVVPKHFTKGEYSMVDISLYEGDYRHIVDKIIENADSEVKEVIASPQEVKKNTEIRMILSSPDIEISDCDETQIWKGKYLTYSFPVEIPMNYAKKQILFIVSVYFNGVIATKLKFIAKCSSLREQKIELTREDVLTAFISYASQDRSRVATIIQGMKKARPDMDIFFDVENLRSGEDWKPALYREIEKRDILFLCWSEYAKASEWVETEWKYALSNKGLEGIEPIPLVSPTVCPPPDELKSKHFNDKALLYNML